MPTVAKVNPKSLTQGGTDLLASASTYITVGA